MQLRTDTLHRVHHSFLTRCIGWRKNNHVYHPISTLIETGSESIEATIRRRRTLFAGCVVCMEDTRLPKCAILGELLGVAGCVGGRENSVFSGRPQSFWYQCRPVDDCSPGRGGMAQDGGKRGGTFHSKMDHCRESQGWTTTCSCMLERNGKNQTDNSPKQACLC